MPEDVDPRLEGEQRGDQVRVGTGVWVGEVAEHAALAGEPAADLGAERDGHPRVLEQQLRDARRPSDDAGAYPRSTSREPQQGFEDPQTVGAGDRHRVADGRPVSRSARPVGTAHSAPDPVRGRPCTNRRASTAPTSSTGTIVEPAT